MINYVLFSFSLQTVLAWYELYYRTPPRMSHTLCICLRSICAYLVSPYYISCVQRYTTFLASYAHWISIEILYICPKISKNGTKFSKQLMTNILSNDKDHVYGKRKKPKRFKVRNEQKWNLLYVHMVYLAIVEQSNHIHKMHTCTNLHDINLT